MFHMTKSSNTCDAAGPNSCIEKKPYALFSRAECNSGSGLHPLYVNVEMGTGNTATNWIDSLQAAFPGVQVVEFYALGKD